MHERILDIIGLRQMGTDDIFRGAGVLFGYPVETGLSKDGKDLIMIFTTGDSGFKVKKLRKKMLEIGELEGIAEVLNPSDDDSHPYAFFYAVNIKDNEEDMKNSYDLALRHLEETLKEFPEFAPPVFCALCNDVGSDTLAINNGVVNLHHKVCLENQVEEASVAFEEKELSPKILSGFIGGAIGGIIGSAPALIALMFFNYFVGFLFALIPLGTFYGWKILGGKLGKLTTVFTIIYTILVSFAVWFASLVYSFQEVLADYYGLTFTFGESSQLLFDFFLGDPDVFFDYFLMDTLIAFGFAIIGIWFAWRQITTTDAHILAETQITLNESMPIE